MCGGTNYFFASSAKLVERDLPAPATLTRYTDEQAYAFALYVCSLRPPANPHVSTEQTKRGETVFHREGCAVCHVPPLYTNNKLTPGGSFTVTEAHRKALDILDVRVGTDARSATVSLRGRGFYKVPSLRGVWYRGPFEHNGSVATLEDWFDSRRLRNDYVPSGFKGHGVKQRAIKGHEFGLMLSAEDKRALIAFLRSL
jgi:CxxC motif-containing protein (DUF1111 family)